MNAEKSNDAHAQQIINTASLRGKLAFAMIMIGETQRFAEQISTAFEAGHPLPEEDTSFVTSRVKCIKSALEEVYKSIELMRLNVSKIENSDH